VVSRGLCLFTTVDASKAPDKERRNLVALAVRRAAPFPDPEFGVAWGPEGHGAVWYWSRARALELLGARGVQARRTDFVPEALYVGGADRPDGAELLELHEGIEARVWRNDRLVADRWWPAMPSAREWQVFLRAAGLPPEHLSAEPPAAQPAPVSLRPWSARSRRQAALTGLSGLESYLPRAALGLGLAATVVIAIQLGSILRSQVDVWRARQAAEALDEPLKRILAARESADRDLLAIQQLLALRPGRSSVALLGEAARLLPPRDWQIRQWNQTTPERIEVTLVMPNPDPQQLVASWEESPMFANVTTDLLGRNGEVVVRADVVSGSGAPAP